MPPRSPASARALLRLALFALFTALLALLVDAGIRHGLRRVQTGSFGATNRMVAGRATAGIVVTGSSRALVHYDPRVLAAATGLPALNLGRNGSHTGLQLAVLRTHLRHNPAPNLVIHNLDLHSLATPAEIHDPGQYLPYLDEPALYDEIRAVHRSAWASSARRPSSPVSSPGRGRGPVTSSASPPAPRAVTRSPATTADATNSPRCFGCAVSPACR